MFTQNKALLLGTILLIGLLFTAFVGPYLPFIDQELQKESLRFHDDGTVEGVPFPPSSQNVIGTDGEGRDLLSLIVMGAAETLLVVLIITVIRYMIALPMALIATQTQGMAHWVIYKWNQVFSSLPTLFAAVILINMPFVALANNRTLWVIIILAIIEAGRVSYVFHQHMDTLQKAQFVEAGKMVGNGMLGIYKRYYMPHIMPQIIVNFVLDLGKVMLLIGQLGFLSIFISQNFVMYDIGIAMFVNESLAWPQLLAEARGYLRSHFWIAFWPAFAIALTVLTFNLFGEGLRQHFESRSKSKYNQKLEKQVVNELQVANEKALSKSQTTDA